MKVPSPTQGNTQPSARGMDYLRPAVPDFSGLVSGLSSLGAGIERASAEAKVKQDQADRFKMLAQVNEFQLGTADLAVETQKNTPLDAANHVETATSSYVNYANKFLEQVDPKFQEEFKLQISNTGQKFGLDARAFQEKQQNAYYSGKLDNAAELAKLQVANDPASMEEHSARMRDMIINVPTWSAMQKAEALHANDMALKGIVYGKEVAKTQYDEKSQNLTTQTIKHFEGYISQAKWDVNAHRVGYGSDTVTKADGTVVKVTPGMVTSREDASRDLQRRIGEFQTGIVKKIGDPIWQVLPENVKAGLTSVAYNYGSLPSDVAEAAKTGDPTLIAQAIKSHAGDNNGGNSDRRNKEALLVAGGKVDLPIADNVDSDPRFAGLPYETRVALRGAAETDANQLIAEQHKQKVAAQSDFYDKTYKGIIANQPGFDQNYADEALQLGVMTPEDHSKITNLINKKSGDATDAAKGASKLAGNELWTTSDQKYANALFGDRGKAELQNLNADFFKNELLPFAQKTNLIPSDAVAAFDSLIRSSNPKQQLFAADALSQLKQAEGGAYDGQVPEDLKKKVDFYEHATSAGMDAKFINDVLANRLTPEESQARSLGLKEAERVLELSPQSQEYNSSLSFDTMLGKFKTGWGWSSLDVSSAPQASFAVEQDFKFLMKENYVKTRNWDVASNLTYEQLKRTWGTTEFGGNKVLMKYPPQTMYPQLANRPNFDFMKEFETQARSDLRLPADTEIQVLSDRQTFADFTATQEFGAKGSEVVGKQLLHDNLPFGLGAFVNVPKPPRPPSYIVMYHDPVDQVWKEARDPTTQQVMRYHFEYTPHMQANEDKVFAARIAERKAIDAEAEVNRGRIKLGDIGKPALDELKQKADEARKAADAAKEVAKTVVAPPVQAPIRPPSAQGVEGYNPLKLLLEPQKKGPTVPGVDVKVLEGYPPPAVGMLEPGNLPIPSHVSDVMLYEENGAYVLLPKEGTDQEAIAAYNKDNYHLGVFEDKSTAEEYIKMLKAKK